MPSVTVQPDGIRTDTREGETVLQALARSGYGFRVGCRRGGCGVCKADLLDGEVDYPVTVSDEVLTDGERATGACLPCRAVPTDDITIRLRDDKLRCCSTLLASIYGAASTKGSC